MNKKLQGMSLLEVMLAFAIASTIALLGIRQYTQYKFARDAFTLKYNVDLLFQGMRNYYYANCAESADADMQLHTLAPSRSPSNPYPLNLQTTLVNYLDPKWRPYNRLVDSSFANSGYEAQFNNVIPPAIRKENFCYFYPGTSQTSPTCDSLSHTSAIVYLWVAQIVVKINDSKMTLALKNLTGADCALGEYTPSSVVDCSTGVTTGTPSYLVWQHLPSFASPDMSSGSGRAASTVKQLNLQYTNDSYWGLVSGQPMYYLCGG